MAVRVDNKTAYFTPPAGAHFLIGDFTDWERRPAIPVQQGQVISLELPRNSWVEYAWADAQGKPFADPDNPQTSLNPWWNYPRAFEIGRYQHNTYLQQKVLADVPRGNIDRLAWQGDVFKNMRRAYVYTPPHYDSSQQYPVFYVQDGVAFYRTGRLGEISDYLLHLGLIEPAILVFLEPNDRMIEYYLNDDYQAFLVQEVFPRIESQYAVRTDAEGRGLWGASLGGLISLYTAAKHPELYSKVVSHSGAYIAHPDSSERNTRTAGEWLLHQLQLTPPKHLRIAMDCGSIEWLLAPNRRMAALMYDLGIAHQYQEFQSGHNWVSWRNALPDALLFLLGKTGD